MLHEVTLMTPPSGEDWRRSLLDRPRVVTFIKFVMRHSPFGGVYRRVETSAPVVALTYDDGPNPPYTQEVLDVLDHYQVNATFFMIGRHIEAHPDTARAVLLRGHGAGNHSYWHPVLLLRTPSFVRSQIAATDTLLRRMGATGEIYFRSPYGVHFFAVPFVLARQKRKNILFDVTGHDWFVDDPACIAQQVLESVQPGSIILLHDGGGPRRGTAVATARIIEQLGSRGYTCVSLSELFALACGGGSGRGSKPTTPMARPAQAS